MKTALYTMSYLEGEDAQGNNRYERLSRWVKYHRSVFQDDVDIWLNDNGSSLEKFYPFLKEHHNADLHIIRNEHLGKAGNGAVNDYPYCWRALNDMRSLTAMGYQKIIFMDNDVYVLNHKMKSKLLGITHGWNAFWIPKYNFPSAELQVLCEDAFPLFSEFDFTNSFGQVQGCLMETTLPFTRIHFEVKGDRYGEKEALPQTDDMDFYSQLNLKTPIRYHQ